MKKNNEEINEIVGDYKYGFTTDAKTVLTSSWRNSKDIGPLREFLAKYEIYFDATPFIKWTNG